MASLAADVSAIRGTVNYFPRDAGRGRFDLVEPERNYMPVDRREVAIRDLKQARPGEVTLEREGLMLASHRSGVARNPEMLDTNLTAQSGLPPINQAYYDELLPLIRELSGAREVIPQATGLTVRFSARSQRQSWAGAAGFIHLDVNDQSIGNFLDFSLKALDREIAPYSRFALIQTWRTVSNPPQDNLLTLCDRTSVRAEDGALYDAVIGEKGTALETVEAFSLCHNPDHRWWYASDMGEEDVLVFVGYDSATPKALQTFHTGFEIPGNENAAPRASLEARFFAFYD